MVDPRKIWAGLTGAVLLCMAGSSTQPAGAQPSRTFAERVEVRVINLEAVVVDRQGRRVRGLGPGDFVLEVDGEVVPVEYFSEIADGLAAAPPADAGSESPAASPGVAAPGERVATSYLVFIDSYFTRLAGRRNRILADIEANLARLGPQDRMAIVAFDGRKLKVLASWSQSPGMLADALVEARNLPARGFVTGGLAAEVDRGIDTETAIAETIEEGREGSGDESSETFLIRSDGLPTDICATIGRLERRIDRAVRGVTATLRSFAQPPGRKVMMLLAGGWPQSAKEYLAGGRPLAAVDCPDVGPSIYRPIYDTANRLGYTLYTVDVPPPASGLAGAGQRGDSVFTIEGGSSGPVGGESAFARTFEVHATLGKLADETGGAAILDSAAESAFEEMVDDTRTYYWLGFTPQWKGDDKRHRVKLRVSRPGLRVRSRSGYLDLSRTSEISYATESALLFGDLPGAHQLGLEIGPVPGRGRGKLAVPLRLTIPMDAITMLPVKRGFAAQLELRIAVVDDGGNRNDMPVVPVELGGAEPPPPGAHAVYETAVRLRRRPHDIVVSLYDPLSDTILAASGSIRP